MAKDFTPSNPEFAKEMSFKHLKKIVYDGKEEEEAGLESRVQSFSRFGEKNERRKMQNGRTHIGVRRNLPLKGMEGKQSNYNHHNLLHGYISCVVRRRKPECCWIHDGRVRKEEKSIKYVLGKKSLRCRRARKRWIRSTLIFRCFLGVNKNRSKAHKLLRRAARQEHFKD